LLIHNWWLVCLLLLLLLGVCLVRHQLVQLSLGKLLCLRQQLAELAHGRLLHKHKAYSAMCLVSDGTQGGAKVKGVRNREHQGTVGT
jgi:hypothetical protein